MDDLLFYIRNWCLHIRLVHYLGSLPALSNNVGKWGPNAFGGMINSKVTLLLSPLPGLEKQILDAPHPFKA